eukprot:CAMPEP_0176408432 /NCGR_PEP_ID=MMETSP0127-20121128/1950_1 /TAXON_ID=938130 /ORGANISM="Platyophrya macrostoma, Strain WH" /LENGTH=212 /DNA_ID=CAMNT_0017787721 /DNA_START=324 /DNA_END=962 /DNA_ORIENTATION=+
MNTLICTSVDDVARVMDRVISAVDSAKECQDATTVFLTSSLLLKDAQLSFLWMQTQSRMKLSKIEVKDLSECFPSIDESVMELVRAEVAQDEGSCRCVVHPPESLNAFGIPFVCCKLESFKLLKAVQILCETLDAVGDEGETLAESMPAEENDGGSGSDNDESWWQAEMERMAEKQCDSAKKVVGGDPESTAAPPAMRSACDVDDLEEIDDE